MALRLATVMSRAAQITASGEIGETLDRNQTMRLPICKLYSYSTVCCVARVCPIISTNISARCVGKTSWTVLPISSAGIRYRLSVLVGAIFR